MTNDPAEIILAATRFAVVGASRSPEKYGFLVYRSLKSAGKTVYPVNPSATTVDDDQCYPTLHDLPDLPEAVVTVVPPQITSDTVKECAALGIKFIWMQPGSESQEAIETAQTYRNIRRFGRPLYYGDVTNTRSAKIMSLSIGQNETLVCLGDSITQDENGYVSLITALIAAKYPERAIKVINSGIGGHRAPEMLERLGRDVIAHHPDWVTINVGINDVWHGMGDPTRAILLPEYTRLVTEIVTTLQEKTKARIILMEPTVIGENPDEPSNQTLRTYCAAMKSIAQEYKVLLAPTHSDFIAALQAGQKADPNFVMTTDGVHMNKVGAARMALTLLTRLDF